MFIALVIIIAIISILIYTETCKNRQIVKTSMNKTIVHLNVAVDSNTSIPDNYSMLVKDYTQSTLI